MFCSLGEFLWQLEWPVSCKLLNLNYAKKAFCTVLMQSQNVSFLKKYNIIHILLFINIVKVISAYYYTTADSGFGSHTPANGPVYKA
jgi:hypothetical protein